MSEEADGDTNGDRNDEETTDGDGVRGPDIPGVERAGLSESDESAGEESEDGEAEAPDPSLDDVEEGLFGGSDASVLDGESDTTGPSVEDVDSSLFGAGVPDDADEAGGDAERDGLLGGIPGISGDLGSDDDDESDRGRDLDADIPGTEEAGDDPTSELGSAKGAFDPEMGDLPIPEEDADGPLSEIATELEHREKGSSIDELFTEIQVDDIDEEEVWDELTTTGTSEVDPEERGLEGEVAEIADEDESRSTERVRPGGSSLDMEFDEPEYRIIPKAKYCQRCEFLSGPPNLHCMHEGTEILEVLDFDHFRVVNCPVVREEEEIASIDNDELDSYREEEFDG